MLGYYIGLTGKMYYQNNQAIPFQINITTFQVEFISVKSNIIQEHY